MKDWPSLLDANVSRCLHLDLSCVASEYDLGEVLPLVRVQSRHLLLRYTCAWIPVAQHAALASETKKMGGKVANLAQVVTEDTEDNNTSHLFACFSIIDVLSESLPLLQDENVKAKSCSRLRLTINKVKKLHRLSAKLQTASEPMMPHGSDAKKFEENLSPTSPLRCLLLLLCKSVESILIVVSRADGKLELKYDFVLSIRGHLRLYVDEVKRQSKLLWQRARTLSPRMGGLLRSLLVTPTRAVCALMRFTHRFCSLLPESHHRKDARLFRWTMNYVDEQVKESLLPLLRLLHARSQLKSTSFEVAADSETSSNSPSEPSDETTTATEKDEDNSEDSTEIMRYLA
ncbi:MAG: hypothetical protein MHM6MM_007251 [Cercozoa sp. M6MM]